MPCLHGNFHSRRVKASWRKLKTRNWSWTNCCFAQRRKFRIWIERTTIWTSPVALSRRKRPLIRCNQFWNYKWSVGLVDPCDVCRGQGKWKSKKTETRPSRSSTCTEWIIKQMHYQQTDWPTNQLTDPPTVKASNWRALAHVEKLMFQPYHSECRNAFLIWVVDNLDTLSKKIFFCWKSLTKRPLHWGPASAHDNRVCNGPLGRSLRSFARTARSAHSIPSSLLCYTCFAQWFRSWARLLISLTLQSDSWNSWVCAHTENAFDRNNRICCQYRHALGISIGWREGPLDANTFVWHSGVPNGGGDWFRDCNADKTWGLSILRRSPFSFF